MKTLEEIKKELRNKLWQYTSNHYGKVAVEWDIFMGKVEEEFESAIKKAVEEAINEERRGIKCKFCKRRYKDVSNAYIRHLTN